MMNFWTRSLSGAAMLAALAAGAALADASALDKFPGAKDAIMSYYAANAREGGNCGAGHMEATSTTPVWSARAVTKSCSRSTTCSAPRRTGWHRGPAPACASSPSPRAARAGRQQHDRPGAVGVAGAEADLRADRDERAPRRCLAVGDIFNEIGAKPTHAIRWCQRRDRKETNGQGGGQVAPRGPFLARRTDGAIAPGGFG